MTEDHAINDTSDASNKAPASTPTSPAIPRSPEAPPVTAIPVAPLVISPKSTQDLSADIQEILKESKLPERTDIKGIADKAIAKPAPVGQPITPSPVSAPAASMPANDPSPVVALHTLKDDIKDVIRENKISLVKAAAMEGDKRPLLGAEPEIVKRRGSMGIVFGIIMFVLLGAAAIFGVIYVEGSRSQSVDVAAENSLVFAEQSASIRIDNASPLALKTQLANARGRTNGAAGSLLRIVPVVEDPSNPGQLKSATAAQFLQALGTHAPDSLLRSLSDQFFFGIHTADKNAPVMVFTVTSYDHAFASMLQWESLINGDLSPAFSAVPATAQDSSGALVQRTFKDDVMRNYDVRELKDDAQNVVMYYSFPTPHLLIIAESPYTFVEIMSRLQAQRQL